MLKIVKVVENSLSPAFQDGDFVVIVKIPIFFRQFRRGDIVVFRHAYYGTMIKLVEKITPGKDEIYVSGTQPESVDSRQFGPIHRKDVLGKVIWHIRKTSKK